MAAKGSIRNAARALGYPVALGDKIAKHIPNLPGVTIQDSLKANKELEELYSKDNEVKHIVDIALKLEGLLSSNSIHASGKLISPFSISDIVPLMVSTKKENAQVMTQFEYYDVEALSLIKFDLLSLKSLDVIDLTVRLIKENKGIDIDVSSIDVNDPEIYKLLCSGYNMFVFQFESSMFRDALIRVMPNHINDLSAITSAWRPACLANGLHEQYIKAKNEGLLYKYELKDERLIKKVQDICNQSYSIMLYQEQCTRCFKDIAGFNDVEGEYARKAISKKKPEIMVILKDKFISGGIKNGYPEDDLNTLFDQIELFAGYSFCAAHAMAYSHTSAYMAWLSAYYPLELFVAALTIDSGNTDDIRKYINAIKERGYKILSPNINKSELGFTIKDNDILFGLAAIKGVGASVLKKIISNRPKKGYTSLGHFILRNLSIVNKKILDSLTKAGCFVDFNNKESILQSIEDILEYISIVKSIDTYTIYDLTSIKLDDYINNNLITKINVEDNLYYEIESLGLYITKHPMDGCELIEGISVNIDNINDYEDRDIVIVVGALNGIEVKKTKAKTNMANFNIDNGRSSLKCICFSKAYAAFMNDIKEGNLVAIKGFIKKDESGIELSVNELTTNIKKYVKEYIKPPPDRTFILDEIKDLTGEKVKIKIGTNIYILEKN